VAAAINPEPFSVGEPITGPLGSAVSHPTVPLAGLNARSAAGTVTPSTVVWFDAV